MIEQKGQVFEFGEFRLDPGGRRLSAAATGEPVVLTPKAVELLTALVCAKGRLLTKEELFDRVWAGTVVEEGNLTQTISVLRRALGEDSRKPRFIVTVPGRGYQFAGDVHEASDERRLDLSEFNPFLRGGPVNTRALESYVQGRSFWNKRTESSLKEAISHFEEAISGDPEFAAAYSGLADSHRLLSEYYLAAIPSGVRVSHNGGDSTLVNEQLVDAHTTLAYAQAFYDWDWAAADRSFRKAITLDPNNAAAHQWYGDYLNVVGRFDEALHHIETAVSLVPNSPVMATGLAAYYYTQKNADALIRQSKRIVELAPDFGYGYFYLGFGYEFSGMEREAIDTFAVAAEKFGEPADIGDELKAAFAQNGMTGVWHKRLEQYETRPHLQKYPIYLKSLVPIRIGDKETSLRWLQQAVRQRDRGVIYAKHEPLLKPLRGDVRFEELISQIGL